jgi:hypothetical protein
MKPRGSRWRRKRRRNSSTGRVRRRCDAMGVPAEIAQRVFRSAEGRLGIDDPVVAKQAAQPCGEAGRFGKGGEVAIEREPVLEEGSLQSGEELTTEDPAQYLDGEEERAPGSDPVCLVGSKAARGGDAVDMRMMLEPLVPGMKHAEKADLGTEVARIAGDFKQGLSAGVEEQGVDQPLVLQSERSEFTRQGEDSMDVAGGQ